MTAAKSGSERKRSTADVQRLRIISRAVSVFSHAGYHATPVSEVADAAGVSPAYVFRLFPGKVALFVAAVEHCYGRVRTAMVEGGESAGLQAGPQQVLEAMTAAYIELIRDRDLIMFQAQAQSACGVPEIRDAVRKGLAQVVTAVTELSHADPADVQRFLAYGQLCHLMLQLDLMDVDEGWADTVRHGIRHATP